MSLLAFRDVSVWYPRTAAVCNVSCELHRGERVAVVGGSGAGKSTLGLAALGLLPRAARLEGTVMREGRCAIAFQDAGLGLNPVMRVGPQVAEGAAVEAARLAMEEAGLGDPDHFWRRYPHELSGGERQRVMVAMALARDPDVLIADEPTTALDPTLRVTLLDRLVTVSRERGLTLVLITHDLAAARRVADRALVMDAGELVEDTPMAHLLQAPASAAAQALVAAMPRLEVPA